MLFSYRSIPWQCREDQDIGLKCVFIFSSSALSVLPKQLDPHGTVA